MMAYVLKKRGKFMEGHSYSTLHGYSFSWTSDEAKARRFDDNDPSVDGFCNRTGAAIIPRANNRAELRKIGREVICIRARQKQSTHPSDARINARVVARAN